jgi:hypothetical protein
MSLRLLAAAVFAASASLAVAAEPTKAEVDAYLNRITESHGRLNQAGRDFGTALGPALQGDAASVLAAYRSYRKMAQVIWAIAKETKTWEMPKHPAAAQVQAANERFLVYQHEVVLSKIPAVLEVLDDAALDADAKREKILAAISRDNEREVELGKGVRSTMDALRQAVP